MTSMQQLKAFVSVLLLSTCPTGAILAQDDTAADLKRLEGRFERKFTNEAGIVFRTVKNVADGKSLVTTFDDVGNVIESHESEYKIQRHGSLRVFTYFNYIVTAGPNKGRRRFESNSYVYRIDGDTIIEAWGLLENDPNPPRMFTWKRVKDRP
jgi:hypothetical protein